MSIFRDVIAATLHLLVLEKRLNGQELRDDVATRWGGTMSLQGKPRSRIEGRQMPAYFGLRLQRPEN